MKRLIPIFFLLIACGKPMPTPHKAVDIVRKSAGTIPSTSPEYDDQLQVIWLGTASYILQLGDVLIITDPFYSYHSLLTTGVGEVRSNPKNVQKIVERLKKLPKPKAIFVGHSHYDHLLDVDELYSQAGWNDVPIYGSESTRNILASYPDGIAAHFEKTIADGQWHQVTEGLRYQAYVAEHAPHMKGVELYSGKVNEPLTSPPIKAKDFKCGTTYALIFELTSDSRRFRIYFTGAATSAPYGFPSALIDDVDLAILCVPGWRLVDGYPKQFVSRLKAPYVMASHYDDFFQTSGKKKQLMFADLPGFVREILAGADYPTFQEAIVPSVGSQVNLGRR